MKLFWGLIETAAPHRHPFDPTKWIRTGRFTKTVERFGMTSELGEVIYTSNTCLTCGTIVEKKFDHSVDPQGY
jgi:hypothetical protein